MPELATQTASVLVVDDHGLFRESVARLLEAEGGFGVVSHCATVDEALAALGRHRPDIVLLDFDLGQRDGLEFIHAARRTGYQNKILIVTAAVDDHEAADLIRSGVSGIFLKHNSAASLAQAIRGVMAGKVWFDQELLRRASAAHQETRAERLTFREKRVLSLVFEGLANKEIAGRIGVSESAIKATLQQLFAKTGVRTRSQLVRIVLEQYRDQL